MELRAAVAVVLQVVRAVARLQVVAMVPAVWLLLLDNRQEFRRAWEEVPARVVGRWEEWKLAEVVRAEAATWPASSRSQSILISPRNSAVS